MFSHSDTTVLSNSSQHSLKYKIYTTGSHDEILLFTVCLGKYYIYGRISKFRTPLHLKVYSPNVIVFILDNINR